MLTHFSNTGGNWRMAVREIREGRVAEKRKDILEMLDCNRRDLFEKSLH